MIVERDGKHPAASALPAQMQALLRRIPPTGWGGKSPRTHVAYVASARHSIVRGVRARTDSSGDQPGRRGFTAAVDSAALQARESLRYVNVQRRPRPLGLIIDAHARSGGAARHVISQPSDYRSLRVAALRVARTPPTPRSALEWSASHPCFVDPFATFSACIYLLPRRTSALLSLIKVVAVGSTCNCIRSKILATVKTRNGQCCIG